MVQKSVASHRASRDMVDLYLDQKIYLEGVAPVLLSTCLFKCLMALPKRDQMKQKLAYLLLIFAIPVVALQLTIISDTNWRAKEKKVSEQISQGTTADFWSDDTVKVQRPPDSPHLVETVQARYGMLVTSMAEGAVATLILHVAGMIKKRNSRRVANPDFRELSKTIRCLRRKKRKVLTMSMKTNGRLRELQAKRQYFQQFFGAKVQQAIARRKIITELYEI